MRYVASLDGLRAVAVVLVMLYHGDVSWAHGGFLGVDMFFVLSGYLITTLLLHERARWGRIDLRQFWLRRARRLLPALFAMLAFVGLLAPLYVSAERLEQLRGDSWATLLYVANWRFIATGQSYFDQFAAPSPLRHVWSLGIEEQWYWFFPLLLVALIVVLRRRRRRVAIALGVLALASAAEMAVLARNGVDQSRIYYGTDTRAQELLVGAVLAVLLMARRPSGRPGRARSSATATAAAMLGAVGIVAILFLAQDSSSWLYRGGFLLFCLFVALLLWSLTGSQSTVPARVLAWHPLVLVGLISYGLYLWHWPIFLLLTPDRTHLTGVALLGARFGATALVAIVSYVLLERPVRAGVLGRRLGATGAVTATLLSVVVVVACVLHGTSGSVPAAAVERSGTYETKIVAPALGQTPVLLVGDSPGRFLSWYLPRDVLSSYALSSSTVIGCGLLPQVVVVKDEVTAAQPQCDGWAAEWARASDLANPAMVLLSTGYWELQDKQVDGRMVRVGTPEYSTLLLAQLERVRASTTHGAVPMVVLNVPCMNNAEFRVGGADLAAQANDPARQKAINDILKAFQSKHPGDVTILDDRSFLCPGGTYAATIGGVQVRPDGVHVGGPGGRVVGTWLKPQLDRIVARQGRAPVLLVGDSVAGSLAAGFDPRASRGMQVWATTSLGCSLDPFTYQAGGRDYPPVKGCAKARTDWPAGAERLAPAVALVIPGDAELLDRLGPAGTIPFGTPQYEDALGDQLDSAIRDAGAAQAAVLTAPCRRVPDGGTDPQVALVNDPQRLAALNDMVRRYADSHPGVELLDLDGFLCSGGYINTKDGVELRSDGLHFTPAGAALVWRWLGPRVQSLVGSDAAG